MKKDVTGYTHRGIGVAIQNAVIAALNSTAGAVPEKRLTKLRGYATAVVEPLREHLTLDHEILRPEELVAVLLAGALFIHEMDVEKSPVSEKPLSSEAMIAVSALFKGGL